MTETNTETKNKMKTFEFRFDVVEEWKATFQAESYEEAKQLYDQLVTGEIATKDLNNYDEVNKGLHVDYEYGLENPEGDKTNDN